ncbi:MAG: TrlF family AAA-like ATPase, partial [Ignavibacteriales bacterium]
GGRDLSESMDGIYRNRWTGITGIGVRDFPEQVVDLFRNPHLSEFLNLKPCVHGSDAHSFENLCKPDLGRYCWIKADPTFKGLKQILAEPEHRIYIGEEPPKESIVRNNRTKYIDSLQIRKNANSKLSEKWFDNDLCFNTGLVSIIGNKGSGKSALADVIALLGHSKTGRFGFLNKDRFCNHKKLNKSKHFNATMHWRSDKTVSVATLDPADAPSEDEAVKYIPQAFLELVCSDPKEQETFEQELQNVIFSHVPIEDRLNCTSLPDLIKERTKGHYQTIEILKGDLKTLNEQIADLQKKTTAEYYNALIRKKKDKEHELASLEQVKPIEPSDSGALQLEASSKANEEISKRMSEIQEIDKKISDLAALQSECTAKIAAIDRVKLRVENFEMLYQRLKKENEADMKLLGIEWDSVVTFDAHPEVLVSKRSSIQIQKNDVDRQLSKDDPGSLYSKKARIEESIRKLRMQLDEPRRRRQAYLEAMKAWSAKCASIKGAPDLPESIQYYEHLLQDLRNVPTRLAEKMESRRKKTSEIYRQICEIAAIHSDLNRPVQSFIQGHTLVKDKFHLNFSTSITVDPGFTEEFLGKIDKSVRGTFYGPEAENRLRDMISAHDFNNEGDTLAFLDQILSSLQTYEKDGTKTSLSIDGQLKGTTLPDFYNYLFSLEYLMPRPALRLGERELGELSPGEKGALLLIFYLLIDKSDIPLVIDQPEENLDNQSVYELLVDCIREAKERRQVFIVTHNPNLAVVCDSEQVIYAHINKENGNEVTYESGSIEDPEMNARIVQVLEGTKPAFRNRESKYQWD